MKVLRSNKDSVMAMLEAFVHDPLINWRLLNTTDANADLPGARDIEPKESQGQSLPLPLPLPSLCLHSKQMTSYLFPTADAGA